MMMTVEGNAVNHTLENSKLSQGLNRAVKRDSNEMLSMRGA